MEFWVSGSAGALSISRNGDMVGIRIGEGGTMLPPHWLGDMHRVVFAYLDDILGMDRI